MCSSDLHHDVVCAGVAELVDALDSGSSVRKDVRVQVSPSAPIDEGYKFAQSSETCEPSQVGPFFECLQLQKATVLDSVITTFVGANPLPL